MKKLNGRKMLRAIGKYEGRCEEATKKYIPRMGKKAPLCYEYLGQLLAYADLIGSCAYGSPGESEEAHAVLNPLGRSGSFGQSALPLMKKVLYLKRLVIVRNIG